MKLISTDTTKCVSCDKCVVVCPMGVITMPPNGFPESTSNAFQLCINCGYCVDVCVFGALYHKVRKRSFSSRAALLRYEKIIKMKKGKKNEK